ncbi:MAG: hypothetical protein VW268_13990 [Rhodospirillaceae bacterium]
MDQQPDLTEYTVDELGAVHLSQELTDWVAAGTAWRRHWLYHRICREQYQRTHGGPPPETEAGTAFSRTGYRMLPGAIPENDCGLLSHSVSQFVENKYGRLTDLDETALSASWSHQRAATVRRSLPGILNSDVTAMIEAYYGCHFQIFSATLNRYLPSEDKDVSFLWHRDCEPPQQLHLMVYLTGASDEGGRTAAVDLEVTRRAGEAGYAYPPLVDRVTDLADVAGLDGDVEFLNPELGPGGAFLFAAPRILHRGQLPSAGWRDTLLMLIWPSPIPWQERFNNNFPTMLRDGPHYMSGALNPFGGISLSPREQFGQPPRWAELSHFFPPEGELPA